MIHIQQRGLRAFEQNGFAIARPDWCVCRQSLSHAESGAVGIYYAATPLLIDQDSKGDPRSVGRPSGAIGLFARNVGECCNLASGDIGDGDVTDVRTRFPSS